MLSIIPRTLCNSSFNITSCLARLQQTLSYAISDFPIQEHEVGRLLNKLIAEDGAGTWPPKVSYKEYWPTELHPYHDICMKMAPLVTTEDVSLDDDTNKERRSQYRTLMEELITTRIDLVAVETCLSVGLTPAAWNGLFGCVSILRHCYR
jgi:hypothetical protein